MMNMEMSIEDVNQQLKVSGFPVISKFVIPSTFTELDKLLNKGGLQNGRFTEIVGEKSCGKTSLAIQFCLSVQLPSIVGGPEGEAIFLSTECKNVRLSQMAQGFMDKWNPIIEEKRRQINNEMLEGDLLEQVAGPNIIDTHRRPYFNLNDLLGKICMYVCPNLPELHAKVGETIKMLESNDNTRIKLVVIDGIGSSDADDNFTRFKSQLMALLYAKHSVSVIVTNTKKVDCLYSAHYFTPQISNYYCAWFPLCQMIQMRYDAKDKKGCTRLVRTTYNENGEGFADFVINDDGICDDPEYMF